MDTLNNVIDRPKFKIIQEKNYAILKNFSNELLIITKHCEIPPKDVEIVYDGGKHALLYRDNQNIKILDFINEQVRPELLNAKEVTVIEYDDKEKIKYEYKVPINKFNKINIEENEVVTINDFPKEHQKLIMDELNAEKPDFDRINKLFSK